MRWLIVGLGVVELAGMVGLSIWGWRVIDPSYRFAARSGPTGIDFTLGKTTGLVLWPMIGLFVLAGSAVGDEGIALIGVTLLAFLLLMQHSSIRRTARL